MYEMIGASNHPEARTMTDHDEVNAQLVPAQLVTSCIPLPMFHRDLRLDKLCTNVVCFR